MGTDHLLFAELSDLHVLTVADLATSHFDTPETRKGNRGGAAQTHRRVPLRNASGGRSTEGRSTQRPGVQIQTFRTRPDLRQTTKLLPCKSRE